MKIDSYARIVDALNTFGAVDVLTFIEGERSGKKYMLADEVFDLNENRALDAEAAEAIRGFRSANGDHEMITDDVFRAGEETY